MQQNTANVYDVFLSYHKRDRALAEAVAGTLRESGLHVYFDRWYLHPGRVWFQELEAALSACHAVAVCIGPGEMGPWQQREVNLALERQVNEPAFPVIPILLAGADPVLGFLGQNTWVDLRKRLDDPESISILEGAIRGRAPGAEATDRVRKTTDAVCPYRGLLHFREEDAPFFFGRELAIERLTTALGSFDFVTVVGASGCGKSSVVRAGLVPVLRRNRATVWEIVTLVPGDRPVNALAAALLPLLEPDMTEADRLIETNKLARSLGCGELRLHDIAKRALAKQTGTDRLLIFVDQFEELYTLTADETVRGRFMDELLEASANAPVSVVATLRGDFIGHALAYGPLSDRLQGAQVNVGPMTRAELASAIGDPAGKVGISFEPGLAERLLDDAGQEPGNLPLLEFVLKQLWDGRSQGRLPHAVYEQIGGLRGALANKAEEIYSRLTLAEKETVQGIFLQLASLGEQGDYTRRRATFAETGAASTTVLERLADARLLVTSTARETGERTVELSHEALIRNWGRLKAWLDQDREFLLWRKRLTGFVDVWLQNAKQETGLLSGAFLVEAEKWLNERRTRLSIDERDYIAASTANHKREQKTAKRRRYGFSAAIIGFGLLALAFALISRREQRHAEEAATYSLALQLAAQSGQIASTRLADALLLGVAAIERQVTFETKDNLFRLLQQLPSGMKGFLWGPAGTVRAIAFSPDGRTIATCGNDGTAVLWDLASRRPTGPPLQGHTGAALSVAFSPDGKTLATGGADRSVILWDVASRKRLGGPLEGHQGAVNRIAFGPSGRTLVTLDTEQTAMRWEVASHKRLARFPRTLLEDVWSIAFTSDGGEIAVGVRGLDVVVLDMTGQKQAGQKQIAHSLMEFAGPPLIVAFSADGQKLATAEERSVSLWDVTRGERLGKPLESQTSDVSSVAFSPDGKVLATGSMDKTVMLWDVATQKPIADSLKGQSGPVSSLTFSPDGTILASGSVDSSVILWDVAGLTTSNKTLIRCSGQLNTIAFSPDGKTLATGDDQSVNLWDMASRKQLGEPLKAGTSVMNSVTSVGFDGAGKSLLAASMDGTLSVWDLTSRQPIDEPLKTLANGARQVAFNTDGKTLANGSMDGPVTLWNIGSREPLAVLLHEHEGPSSAVAFSPDGKTLAAGGRNHTVMVWDVSSRSLLGEPMKGHTGDVRSIAFSPDGRILASGSSNGSLILWDVATHRPLGGPLTAHNGMIMAIAFSPKERVLATGGSDQSVVVWDIASHRPLGEPFKGHSAEVTAIAYSPDGETLATGSWDKSVILQDGRGDAESMQSRACQVLNRNFTEDEWRRYMSDRPYRKVCPAQLGPIPSSR